MDTREILLNDIGKVNSFMQDIQKLESDMDMYHGRYVVDARSAMALFSLDLSKPVMVVIHTQEDWELDLFNLLMNKYEVK